MTADYLKRVASIMSTKLASFRGQSLQQAIVDCNSSKVAAAATRASRGCGGGWAATAHLLFFLSFAVVGDRALRPRWGRAGGLHCNAVKKRPRGCAPHSLVRSRRSRYALGLLRTILLSKYPVGCFELSHSMHEILFQWYKRLHRNSTLHWKPITLVY